MSVLENLQLDHTYKTLKGLFDIGNIFDLKWESFHEVIPSENTRIDLVIFNRNHRKLLGVVLKRYEKIQ